MKKPPLAVQIILAVFLGSFLGWVLGPRAEVLGEAGTLLIRLLKALATPLIFFAIIDAFFKTEVEAKSGIKLLLISTTNAIAAGVIALGIATLLPYGIHGDFIALTGSLKTEATHSPPSISADTQFGLMKSISSFIPSHILEPFVTNNVISVVLISILIGMTIRKLRNPSETKNKKDHDEFEVLEKLFNGGFRVVSGVLSWIVQAVPIAVLGVVAKMVGMSGFAFFSTLGFFAGCVAFGIFVHSFIYYSIVLLFVARVSPVQFFQRGGEALFTAFGTGSSLATLPVTLQTLQSKMKISPQSSRLAACVGTNLNHNGILLYEAVAALFVAQVYGVSLNGFQKVSILFSSALAAVGIAGVPEAGLITLSLVLNSAGLPLTLVPVLMTVDWLIGRLRATSNVASDMVVATLLDYSKTRKRRT